MYGSNWKIRTLSSYIFTPITQPVEAAIRRLLKTRWFVLAVVEVKKIVLQNASAEEDLRVRLEPRCVGELLKIHT